MKLLPSKDQVWTAFAYVTMAYMLWQVWETWRVKQLAKQPNGEVKKVIIN